MSVMFNQFAPVLFGEGAVNELPDKIKEFGAKTALVCYDRGVAGCGIGDRVVGLIRDAGLEVFAFDEVLPDPPDTQIDAIYHEYKDKGVDLIVGLGGGSCMDTAKGVAFMFTNNLETISGNLDIATCSLRGDFPLIEIPTASGTGSEASPVAVITDTAASFKGGVLVRTYLAIVDPELTKTAPPFVTASSGMDAFAHAAEAMTSKHFNPKADALAYKAISNIVKYLPTATHEGDNMEARSAMSVAANLAGMAFSDAFVHMGHAIAETVGAIYHQPHGLCCGLCLPAALEFAAEYGPAYRIKNVADAMGLDYSDIEDDGPAIGIRVGDAIRDLMHECDVPSFADRGLSREDFMKIVPEMTSNFHMLDCIVPVTEEITEKYAARIYDLYQ